MTFIRNAWYPASWSADLGSAPIARTFLDEPIVLFRTEDGAPAALADICPHRFAPLSAGQLTDRGIRCPYHGLTFDASGHCIHNPHGKGVIPAALTVRDYPLHVSDGMVWILDGSGYPRRAPAAL